MDSSRQVSHIFCKTMKTIQLVILVCVFPLTVLSQDLLFQDYAFSRDSYTKFINYGRSEGVPDTRVNAFAQDSRGFIWIGTAGGLCRFDGYTFEPYFQIPGDSSSLPSSNIFALATDRDNHIWIGTASGLSQYNLLSNNFIQIPVEPLKQGSTERQGVRGLLTDEDGGLWVLLQNGAVYYKAPTASSFRFIVQAQTNESSYTHIGMLDDGKGRVWIGAMFIETLLSVDKKTLAVKSFTDLPLNTPVYEMTAYTPGCAFLKTADGSVFMGNAHGVLCLISGTMTMQPTTLGNTYAAVTDSRDRIWAGGYSGGLLTIDRRDKTIVQYEVNGDEKYSLSHNQILNLFTDREDNIWIATSSGLSMLSSTRFKFKHLRHLNVVKNSIPSNRIWAVHQAPDQTLWVGTENDGLFSIKNDQVEHFKYVRDNPGGIVSRNVTGITSAADGSLWLSFWNGFGGGFNRLDPATKKFEWVNKPTGSYWNSAIKAMPDGQLYLGCWGPGLFVLDPQTRMLTNTGYCNSVFYHRGFAYRGLLYGELIQFDLEGEKSKAFIAPPRADYSTPETKTLPNMKDIEHFPEAFDTASLVEYGFARSGFLYRFNYSTEELSYVPYQGSQPTSMVLFDGKLFVAGNDGIGVYHSNLNSAGGADSRLTRQPAIQLRVVQGQLFILRSNQVERYHSGKVEPLGFAFPDTLHLVSFDADKGGNLLLAGQRSLWYKPRNAQVTKLLLENEVVDAATLQINEVAFVGDRFAVATNQGLLLTGTRMPTNHAITRKESELLFPSFPVFKVTTDEAGKIFASTSKGLISFDPVNHATEEFRYRTRENALWNTLITVMTPDSFGRLWIGGSQNGYLAYYNFKSKRFTHYLKKENASDQIVGTSVQAIGVDRQRRVWVGTEEAFMQLDEVKGTYKVIRLWNGKTLSVSSITPDHLGHLWLGTPDGLFQFDPLSASVIRRYTLADGLQSNEFGPGATVLADGQIVVSGPKGMNIFDPTKFPVDTVPPSPLVVRLKVDTVVVHNAGEHADLKFPYRKCDYEIEFSAMKFSNAEGSSYTWKLEGYDQQWRESLPGQNKVLYSNLWPGRYRLLLKAGNADGYWSEAAVKLEFVVSPPFWLAWWFVVLILFSIILLLFFVYRWRIARLRFHQEVLERTVKQRTAEIATKNDELKVQYESIQVKNEEILAQRDEIEAQRDQIESQRDEVMAQKETIVLQNKAITDSIEYARRIQQATLPHNELNGNDFLAGHFAFHRPRDIVSGDFYWASCHEDALVVAVADCTGHSVPGAFMSMLGISFLNRIVNENGETDPAAILEALRKNVIEALHQSGRTFEAADGMDISVVTLKRELPYLTFASANAQALLVHQGSPVVMKGDKMPVAFYDKMNRFTTLHFPVQSGDTVYMFSDGYSDQFGGEKGRKLKIGNFREFLVNLSSKPIANQYGVMEQHFLNWIGPNDQVDDITVLGLLIK